MLAYTITTPNTQKAERAVTPLLLPSCSHDDYPSKMKMDRAEQLDDIEVLVKSATSQHLAGKAMKGRGSGNWNWEQQSKV